MSQDDVAFGQIALCYRNETRRRLNVSRRRALGITGKVLRAGEPVMLLRNDHRLQVYNGGIYSVVCDREPGDDLQVLDEAGRVVSLMNTTCEMVDDGYAVNRDDESYSPVALAYAATVHKAQGAEWNDVLFVDEYERDHQRCEFVYTAITRAAKRILVVRT